jgi:phage tail-like protein
MTEVVSLLPANATPWETAVSLTSAERHPWPVDLVRAVWDPETCPEHLLGHLAWAMSVDIWDDTWGVDHKRAVISRSLDLHRRKGTLSAIRDHIDLVGGRLVSAVVPPQGFFLADDFDATDPGWRRWLASLPEIRIDRIRTARPITSLIAPDDGDLDVIEGFFGDEAGEPGFPVGGALAPDEVEIATLVAGGVETPLAMLREPDHRHGRRGEVIRFLVPRAAGPGLWMDIDGAIESPLGTDGGVAIAPDEIVVALGPPRDGVDGWNVVSQDLDRVQDVQPEAGTVTFEDPVAFACGGSFEGFVLGRDDQSEGARLILRLLRGAPKAAPVMSFLDIDRLGMDPYTAELTVDLTEPASSDLFVLNGGGYLDAAAVATETDTRRLDEVVEAILSAKAARDRIYVDLDYQPPGRSLASTRRVSDLVMW